MEVVQFGELVPTTVEPLRTHSKETMVPEPAVALAVKVALFPARSVVQYTDMVAVGRFGKLSPGTAALKG